MINKQNEYLEFWSYTLGGVGDPWTMHGYRLKYSITIQKNLETNDAQHLKSFVLWNIKSEYRFQFHIL